MASEHKKKSNKDFKEGRIASVSHKEQVLAALEAAGERGCSKDELVGINHRFGADILVLRKEGRNIVRDGTHYWLRGSMTEEALTRYLKELEEDGKTVSHADLKVVKHLLASYEANEHVTKPGVFAIHMKRVKTLLVQAGITG